MIAALGRAIQHAQMICHRKHYSFAADRVGQLVTSIRQESFIAGSYRDVLINTDSWSDIGILNTDRITNHKINKYELDNIVKEAHKSSAHQDIEYATIVRELDDLKNNTTNINQSIDDARHINGEADILVAQLREFLS